MSELINNREYRQKILKELIKELHDGKSVEEVKERFAHLIEGISPSEISEMEQSLIMEGMPVSEIQRLCDVHAEVFKGSIEEIHQPQYEIGHPIHTLRMENRAIEELIKESIKPHLNKFKQSDLNENRMELISDLNLLWDIDKHYSRKENLLFPYLEKYQITAPPQVMWGVDDEIRAGIKHVKSLLTDYKGDNTVVVKEMDRVLDRIIEMIFKEENILIPMAFETLSEDEWLEIARESHEIGYCLTHPKGEWVPERVNVSKEEKEKDDVGNIVFETGVLSVKEISAIFNHLPIDVTFVNKDDVVKYFSHSKERIFARTKSVIGRKVENCHPPGSVHIVEKMVEDFKSGKKDSEDFWINMGPMFVYIRYFAVRDKNGEYMGTLEVTQNIKPIKEIHGEKRLLAD